MKEQRIKFINYQIVLSVIFIFTILVSIFLAYNQKKKLLNEPELITFDTSYYITLINRVIVLLILATYVYFDYMSYKYDEEEKKGLIADTLEIIASVLSVLAAIIILIAVYFFYYENAELSFENPEI